jgi:hypothetical protein
MSLDEKSQAPISDSGMAQGLYFNSVEVLVDRLKPADFELPDSIGEVFQAVSGIYHTGSMLLALETAARKDTTVSGVRDEFRKFINVGLEGDQAKYVSRVYTAAEDLRRLFDEKSADWRESEFAKRWLAQVGVARFITPVQPGQLTSFRVTDYWMNTVTSMTKLACQLDKLSSAAESKSATQKIVKWLADTWRRSIGRGL